MKGARWKEQVRRSNFLIFKRITCIPTHTIRVRKITQISVGTIIKILILIKVCKKVNKLRFKGSHHNWKRPCIILLKPLKVNKNHEIISGNHDASVKNLETQIGQLSRQIVALPSSRGGFTGKNVDIPKNESCKAVDTGFGVIIENGKDEILEEDMIEKKNEELKKRRVEIKVTKRKKESPLIKLQMKILLGGEQRSKP